MAAVHLLRCKAVPKPQLDAFAVSRSSPDIVADSFKARPTAKVQRGAVWHIGNTSEIESGALFFALGREAIVKKQQFDVLRKEFEEIEQNQAPFTLGVYDLNTQAAAILIREGVSLKAREVASKLEALLESTGYAARSNTKIVVDPIANPQGFIEILQSARRVTRFEFDFSLPNPPDDDKYVQRPLKEFGKRVGAVEGRASLKGPSLKPDELVELTRALAAEGDDATANVERYEGGGIEKIGLNHNPMRETVDTASHEGGVKAMLAALRSAYARVRNGIAGGEAFDVP